jgi:hypothetical protein
MLSPARRMRTVSSLGARLSVCRGRRLADLALVALLVVFLFSSVGQAGAASAPAHPSGTNSGPTLRLEYGPGQGRGNPVAAFMYFVPLISPDPVACVSSSNNTQTAQVTSAKRQTNTHTFLTKCDFEFTGQGTQQNIFDLSKQIRHREKKLKEGGVMRRQLASITVEGQGSGSVEVEGTVTNGVQTVTEVRLRINARGKASPVSIILCDIRYLDGEFKHVNEIVAQVKTLTFRRKPGPPKMEVTVGSVRNKGAGNNLWQSIKGGIKGAAANLLIDPLTVEARGHRAMLDFGQALVSGAPSFTFPRAKNLLNPAAEPL